MPKRSKGGRGLQRIKQNQAQHKKHSLDRSGQKNVLRKSGASTNPNRSKEQSNSFYRDRATIKRLNMYRNKPNLKKMYETPTEPARIEPDRKWFGNTRVADQKLLDQYRTELAQKAKDPYTVLVKGRKIPLSLLTSPNKASRANLLQIESFESTFGKKATRKRPKLDNYSLQGLMRTVEEKKKKYDSDKDIALLMNSEEYQKEIHIEAPKDLILSAGSSKRIWEELYKVIDASDVLIQVLDARDPMGTRSPHIEHHLKKNHPHKHLVFLLNKCDLVPTWVTKRWIAALQIEYPTIAYRASVTNPFGKGSLIQTLRQFDNFHKDRKNISVGFIGYPNTGKSSVINSLKSKAVCKSAPIPGQTKVWQYIALTKRIYLIDSPGVVYEKVFEEIQRNSSHQLNEVERDSHIVLRGVVRAQRLKDPQIYIDALLNKAKVKNICQVYGIMPPLLSLKDDDEKFEEKKPWTDGQDFLTQLAVKMGRLKKGAEPDLSAVARIVLTDWQRGRISYFMKPPTFEKTNITKEETRVPEEKVEGEREFIENDIVDSEIEFDESSEEELKEEDLDEEENEELNNSSNDDESEGIQSEDEDEEQEEEILNKRDRAIQQKKRERN